jgi:hypothetical protein
MPYGGDGAQMYGGRQPSGCLGPDGGVWFPSNKGAIHVLPEQMQPYAAPRILITGAVSDGRELSTASRLVLPADSSRLELAFTPLMLRPQEGIRFRYPAGPTPRQIVKLPIPTCPRGNTHFTSSPLR